MNMMQLAKLMTAGVLAMAAVPAISFARTHHPVQAIAPSLSATTVTPIATTAKPARLASVSHKHKSLSVHKKTARGLSHRGAGHRALSHRAHSRTTLSHRARKAANLSSKKKGL